MNNICKLCVHSDIDVKAHPCNDCGDDFSMFKFGIEQQLAQAHRQGWEQCKRECTDIVEKLTYEFTNESAFNRGYLRASTECMEQIASIEYKEAEDE